MTEIAPGMMVECIYSPSGINLGRKNLVLECKSFDNCEKFHGPCNGLRLLNWPAPFPCNMWAACCFKPTGGDKEIERQESKRTGKSAKGDMRNGTDHPQNITFHIFDMDDK